MMARAIRCDRCGGFEADTVTKHFVAGPRKVAVSVCQLAGYSPEYHWRMLDLCIECRKSMDAWWHSLKDVCGP